MLFLAITADQVVEKTVNRDMDFKGGPKSRSLRLLIGTCRYKGQAFRSLKFATGDRGVGG